MSTTVVRFANAQGHQLSGQIDRPPKGEPRAWALFAHCFTCTRQSRAAHHVSRGLAARGYGVLRFDFTGLGDSEGEFAATGFSSNVDDLCAAADWLAREHGAPSLLVGHSLGGTAVLAAAPRIDSCRAVATVGAPAEPAHVRRLLRDAEDELLRHGEATVDIGGRTFRVRSDFLHDLERQSLPGSLRHLRRALLILHSPADREVSVDNAATLFSHALHPKSFVSLDGADHLLSREEDARYAAGMIAAWASHYVEETAVAEEADGEAGVLRARTDAGAFVTRMQVDGHRLVADEPRELGGADTGPSPYDFLNAALASCTGMTLQMYARHKRLALESVQVEVHHGKLHARDCSDCEQTEGKIDVFTRRIALKGELSDEQRERMLQIAERCPVHRTLHAEVKVRTELIGDGITEGDGSD